jgi:hypothetical protein
MRAVRCPSSTRAHTAPAPAPAASAASAPGPPARTASRSSVTARISACLSLNSASLARCSWMAPRSGLSVRSCSSRNPTCAKHSAASPPASCASVCSGGGSAVQGGWQGWSVSWWSVQAGCAGAAGCCLRLGPSGSALAWHRQPQPPQPPPTRVLAQLDHQRRHLLLGDLDLGRLLAAQRLELLRARLQLQLHVADDAHLGLLALLLAAHLGQHSLALGLRGGGGGADGGAGAERDPGASACAPQLGSSAAAASMPGLLPSFVRLLFSQPGRAPLPARPCPRARPPTCSSLVDSTSSITVSACCSSAVISSLAALMPAWVFSMSASAPGGAGGAGAASSLKLEGQPGGGKQRPQAAPRHDQASSSGGRRPCRAAHPACRSPCTACPAASGCS